MEPSSAKATARTRRPSSPIPTSARSASTSSRRIWPTGMVTLIVDFASRPLWEVAVMTAVPSPTPVTTPFSLTVTTLSSLLSQVKSVAEW